MEKVCKVSDDLGLFDDKLCDCTKVEQEKCMSGKSLKVKDTKPIELIKRWRSSVVNSINQYKKWIDEYDR